MTIDGDDEPNHPEYDDVQNLGGYSPESALYVKREQPLLKGSRTTVRERRIQLRLTRLAKQYIVDFNLVRACARAGLDWDLVKHAERDPFFLQLVQELIETIDPDAVATRQEILMQLKKEAFTADKAAARIAALNSLAELMGMKLPDPSKKDTASLPPIINITLTQPPK